MFRATGKYGELRLGYQVVARLGNWALDGDRLEARASDVNAFYFDQPGALALWLRMGDRCWVWQAVDVVDRSGTPMIVRVAGSPTVRDAPTPQETR